MATNDVPKFTPPHPPEWEGDLNPHDLAGESHGAVTPHPGKTARTAYDVKSLHRRLHDIDDADLKQIPVLPEGTRLAQGGTYLDLADPEGREFTASAQDVAALGTYYVPKNEVPYPLWNRLIGVENPSRLDQPDGTEATAGRQAAATAGEGSQRSSLKDAAEQKQGQKGGMPGDGKGRVDETGHSGVYPVSASAGASGDAPLQGEASWGQGDRGAAGYDDHGSSETIVIPAD